MKNKQEFKDLVWDAFSQYKHFDKISNNLLNARETMYRHKHFSEMPVKAQFDFCVTVVIIATDTLRQHLNEHRPLSRKQNVVFERSIDRGFNTKTKYYISDKSLLNEGS